MTSLVIFSNHLPLKVRMRTTMRRTSDTSQAEAEVGAGGVGVGAVGAEDEGQRLAEDGVEVEVEDADAVDKMHRKAVA